MTAKPSLPTRTPSAVPVAVPTSTPQTRGSALATASPTATDSASPAAPTPGDAATVSGSARATASTTPTGSFAFSATLAEANLPTAATAYWASPSDLAPAGDWTGSWGDAEQFSACGGNWTRRHWSPLFCSHNVTCFRFSDLIGRDDCIKIAQF